MTNTDLRDALKRAASALKAHGPEFALAGSYALWAYGGPEPVHDVDFVVAQEDTEAAALTLEKAGFRIDRTPEDWLFKACVGEKFVIDVLHQLNGKPMDADMIASAEELDVLAIRMRVLSPTQVIIREAELTERAPLRLRGAVARDPRGARARGLGPGAREHHRQRLRGRVSGAHRPAGHHCLTSG